MNTWWANFVWISHSYFLRTTVITNSQSKLCTGSALFYRGLWICVPRCHCIQLWGSWPLIITMDIHQDTYLSIHRWKQTHGQLPFFNFSTFWFFIYSAFLLLCEDVYPYGREELYLVPRLKSKGEIFFSPGGSRKRDRTANEREREGEWRR